MSEFFRCPCKECSGKISGPAIQQQLLQFTNYLHQVKKFQVNLPTLKVEFENLTNFGKIKSIPLKLYNNLTEMGAGI